MKFSLKNNFKHFQFFYKYLGWRIVAALGLSLGVGVLDGLGLALFIPLIQLVVRKDGEALAEDSDAVSNFILNTLEINPTLLNIFFLIFLFFSLKGIMKFFESYTRTILMQIFMRKIRFETLELLNNYSYDQFVKADAGKIQNTLSSEVNKLNMANRFYFKAIQFFVLILVYFALALGSDWKFTILVISGGLIVNQAFKFLYARTKYFSRQLVAKSHIFHKLLMQKVSLYKYLKATGLLSTYSSKLKNNINEMEFVQRKLGMVDAALGSIREPISILVIFGAIFFYVQLFDEVVGGILLSLLLLYRAITFFMAAQEQWNMFLGVSGSIENIQEFTQDLSRNKEVAGNLEFPGLKENIVFRNLSFTYEEKNLVLKHFQLAIKKNETLAIVGPSGSGKSTLINLLTGILKPTSGEILIDGYNISDFKPNSYRKKIGYIVQDPVIFSDSIFNNVTFWAEKSDYNLKRFYTAIEKAAILDFVDSLPGKENSILGNNGINVSGGQKQRLSIARELYKDVDLLLLDEATSSLDSETEAEIHMKLDKLKGAYTMLIIAHRISTIKGADRIIMLQNGKIEATGKYSELIDSSASFRRMLSLQEL
ncbi:ABC-type multidrug transport system fused ATPase/permease subunit [Salegentibacter sp. 24]|uniref:ABC transporter ATP-binding protein n=1 Tax=Salegentibacter sp. 24 TaxID=2183986 RepID=UPI00105C3252|nr:ABC transporter ATP-binding protein [Salegentibacter sp. 24]TDN82173.1 ABC-type multidrug transport system fused ATPase/permease subunit [Salegentibacter sp. 24]